jgi:DNA polymerase III delta subunit
VPPGAVLVFEVAQPGALANSRFYRWIAAHGGLVRCDALGARYGLDRPDSPLAGAVEQRGRTLGLELDPGAVMALIERCGQHLGILEEELAKLALALGAAAERKLRVSRAQIEEVCARTRLINPFEYVDAVAERDLRRATEALGAIFARGLGDRDKPGRAVTNEGEIVFRLLALLNWKFNELQDLRAALDEGGREGAVFAAANIRGMRQDILRRTLRKHTAASLRRAMEALLRANLELRASGSRQEAMERLTWALARDA